MKKIIIVCFLVFGFALIGNAQDAAVNTTTPLSFSAGGTSIAIPSPALDMVEVGYDNREFLEVFVASGNRLLAAFVLNSELPELTKKSSDLSISRYTMVQVPRRGEYMDCTEGDFKEITDAAKDEFGDVMDSSMKEAEAEFNRRMESLDLDDAAVSFGKPIQLGPLLSKGDAYGFGMIMPLSMGEEHMNMGMACILMRVKHRLLFVYLYAEYENEDTVKWLRNTAEKWSDAILIANKE